MAMSDEVTVIICMAAFLVALHEQSYHFEWGNNTDYWNAVQHQKLLMVWLVLGGAFLLIGSWYLAKLFLQGL